MIVKLRPPPQFACLSDELLTQSLKHSIYGEKTKFKAMFTQRDCIVLPEDPSARFKILSVGRHIVEFTNAKNQNASKGLWANKEAFVQVER